MDKLLPSDELASDTLHYLVREIFTNTVLVNMIEKFSDGDFVNQCFIKV